MTLEERHSTKHLQEAQEVTIFGEEQHQIELQLGHVCNNRCVFCVSGQLTEQRIAKQIDAGPVLKAIRDGAERGVKRLTFLGGEPTTQRSFMPALREAVQLGYEEIVIFTNGIRTRKKEFIDKIVNLGGKYEWRFSVQGATRESHDRVTLRPGSFDRLVTGMEYVASLGEDVTINMCVNEYSYRALPHYRELLERYKVRQLHIDQVRPSDAGDRTMEYFKEIMPKYSEMAPYFAEMLERIEEWDPDYDVNLGNYPYCQLPEWAHKIHHDGQKTFTYPADGYGNFCDPFDKYPTKRQDKSYVAGCKKCVFMNECNGVFDTYAEMYGTDEFQAISKDQLRQLDKRLNFFVILVEDYLHGFVESSPPEPWKKVELFRNTRDRVIEVRFVDEEERRATLVLTPPTGRGKVIDVHAPILETNHFRMSLFLDNGIRAAHVATLVQWAEGQLTAHDDVHVESAVDYDRLLMGLLSPERLRKGRSRVMRLTNTLRATGTFAEWNFQELQPLPAGRGVVVTVGKPDKGSIELVLEVQAEDDKPLVGVRYSLSEETKEEDALPAVRAMMAALRG
jgi:MoaA/NifB/PqqE/SkfB family radical SAM enzyme